MIVRVANIRKLHRLDGELRVYIGRKGQGYDESPLANPFRSRDLPGGKTEAISRYKDWLRAQLRDTHSPQAREILRLSSMVAAGQRVVLMCWCHPAACHGDVVCAAVTKVAARMSGVPHGS